MNYNRGFLASLMIIGLISAMAGYGTVAYFSDVESAEENVLQAGTIDIDIDEENPWMSTFTLEDMKPSEMYQQWTNVTINNVGTNDARVCKMINITSYGGGDHPESEWEEDSENTINKISAAIEYWNFVEIYDANDTLVESNEILMGHLLLGVDEEEYLLGVIPAGGYAVVTQRYHMFNETTNWAQGDNMTFDMHFYAQQINDPEECGHCSGVETMYLADCGSGDIEDDGTTVYEVVLDDDEQRAYLNKMFWVDSGIWDKVGSLSSSNDGSELYLWDKDTEQLGTYDLVTETFDDGIDYSETEVGGVGGIVLGAVNPDDGLIYGASDDTDEIVTIDPKNVDSEVLGTVTIDGTSDILDVQGADLIFDAYGNLILYTNADDAFYVINLDDMTATESTVPSPSPDYFTGIAIREAGTGDLVGSTNGFTSSGNIFVIDRDTGDAIQYEPYFGMTPYTVGYGDMAVGVICPDPDSVIESEGDEELQ